jgi:transcriptional regulator of met regulon
MAARRTNLSVLDARMVEIETQFCARDIISNLMHANDLRMLSMLWKKTFDGSTYPTDNTFYPKVCNQNVAATAKGED